MSLPFFSTDLPVHVILCMWGFIASAPTVIAGIFKLFIGTLPDPSVTGSWSFYGVLIAAIIVLFSCGIVSIRWFFGYWLKRQEDFHSVMIATIDKNTLSNHAVAEATNRNTEVTKKSNEWFEDLTRDGFKQLNFPRKP